MFWKKVWTDSSQSWN